MTTNVSILADAGPGLVEQLADLVNRVYAASERGLWRDGTTRTTAGELARLVAAGQIAVAMRDGRLVGSVWVSGDAGEFGMLAADPEQRGTGIGRALVEFAEQRGRDRGRPTMRLELLVPRVGRHPDKEFLRAWYGRRGYRHVGTTTVQDAHPHLAPLLTTPCDVTRWAKQLTGTGPRVPPGAGMGEAGRGGRR